MLGAIAGDVIGSAWEAGGFKHYDFQLFTEYSKFTDDTVMSIAVAAALLDGGSFEEQMLYWGRRYPLAGYGRTFSEWLRDPTIGAYNSWGNGSAMRVGPIGFAGRTEAWVLEQATLAAEVTHNHPEGIKGARAIALAVFLARHGHSRETLRAEVRTLCDYDLDRTVDEIRPDYTFDASCQRSVPESIICFLDSEDFEGAIRNAVSLGGDTDTMACMSGAIAEAFYGSVPEDIADQTRRRLPDDLAEVLDRFIAAYPSAVLR